MRSLLQATLKVFTHELSRLWDDLSPDMDKALKGMRSAEWVKMEEREGLEVIELANPVFQRLHTCKIFALQGSLRMAILPGVDGTGSREPRARGSLMHVRNQSAITPVVPRSKDEYGEVFVWKDVHALATYDGTLLLWDSLTSDTSDNDAGAAAWGDEGEEENSEKKDKTAKTGSTGTGGSNAHRWFGRDPLFSLNVREADVRPLITLGLDAFVVEPR